MAVQLRVRRVPFEDPAGGGVPVLRGDQLPRGLLNNLPAVAAAHGRHRLGEVRDRLADRGGVRGLHISRAASRRRAPTPRRPTSGR